MVILPQVGGNGWLWQDITVVNICGGALLCND